MKLTLLYEAYISQLPSSEDDWLKLIIAYLKRDKGRNKILHSTFLKNTVEGINSSQQLMQLLKQFKKHLQDPDLVELATMGIEEEEANKEFWKQQDRNTHQAGKAARAEKQERIEAGDSHTEVFKLLNSCGAKRISTNDHHKWLLPNGVRFTTPATPSNHRSWNNSLGDLRKLLRK